MYIREYHSAPIKKLTELENKKLLQNRKYIIAINVIYEKEDWNLDRY